MWCVTSMSAAVWSTASLARKSRECWLLYFCLLSPPLPLWIQRWEISSGWRRAGVWPGGPLDTDSVIVHSCHCPPPSPIPLPFPPATLWPSSPLGHPLLPRLPNEEWHASGGSDLVWSRGPCLLCFVFHYWLQWLTPSRSDESGFIPKRRRSRIAGGAQRAEAIVWNCEDLIVFIHELCDWY